MAAAASPTAVLCCLAVAIAIPHLVFLILMLLEKSETARDWLQTPKPG
jgi:hypothetical protein